MSELESAKYWLSWIEVGSSIALFLVAIGVGYEFIANRLERPFRRKLDAAREAEFVRLNNDTARLQAENLTLQRVMLPRRLSIFGFNETPKAETQFAGIRAFADTEAWIQVASDDEAKDLANDILFVLNRAGWRPRIINESTSHLPSRLLSEGVSVLSPVIERAPHTQPDDPQVALAHAADALARSLTSAGLGIREFPVSHSFLGKPPLNPPLPPYFDPPLTAVFIEVGPRPIAMTLRMMEQDRQSAPK